LVTGDLVPCIILGGSLQFIALAWANIGAAVAPDAALASIASALILVLSGQGADGVNSSIAIAIPLAIAGLFLTIFVRTLATGIVHFMDAVARKGNRWQIEMWHIIAVCMLGIRIVVPTALILILGAKSVRALLEAMPDWLTDGLAVGGG